MNVGREIQFLQHFCITFFFQLIDKMSDVMKKNKKKIEVVKMRYKSRT